ncbi:hypothetical protein CF138_17395 [Aeromonas hydrophila]|jgi:hypothetical protein|uniref:hypothetical protein n=1 Tax=Aeromonas TaxID=642 RepID=UPI0011167828|nr:hypothetical protein [Aeromonas hydrophila]TNH82876.1 hypothetical protein CF138_17395 [Aeromonas hydrophila]TNI00261.1 hypothetical protein CF136_10700 [Aeromonas hydrophila]TNI92858.1 hypothetical protein CF118_17940 [Aeromonas hydrophila]
MKMFMKFSIQLLDQPVLMEDMVIMDGKRDRLEQLQTAVDDLIAVLHYGEGWALLMGDNAIGVYPSWRVPRHSKLFKFMPEHTYIKGAPVATGPVLLVHDSGVDFGGFTQEQLMKLLR